MLLGNKIKSLRDEQGILQGQVAAYLEIAFFLIQKKHTTESFPFQLCALIIYKLNNSLLRERSINERLLIGRRYYLTSSKIKCFDNQYFKTFMVQI